MAKRCREEASKKRFEFAAHCFVYTSRDGMIISQLTEISPFKLYKHSETKAWKKDLSFWRYTGKGVIEGEEFNRQVSLSLQKRSLQYAARLWKELYGKTESKQHLRAFLGSEAASVEGTVGAED